MRGYLPRPPGYGARRTAPRPRGPRRGRGSASGSTELRPVISCAYLEAQTELSEAVAAHGVDFAFERAEDGVFEAAGDLHDPGGVTDELRQPDVLVCSAAPTVVFVLYAQLSVRVACSAETTSPAVYFDLSLAVRRHILI